MGGGPPTPVWGRSGLGARARGAGRGGRGVWAGGVGKGAGGRVTADAGVGPVVVVGVQLTRKGCAAVGFAGEQLGEGPLAGHGAVDPLYLAVGLRPVGPGPLRGGAWVGGGGG